MVTQTYGKKIIVDTYGGAKSHGGGVFSGKDPTKVDRSAAYASRYLAKNVVAAGVSDKCLTVGLCNWCVKTITIFIKLGNGDEGKVEKVKIIEDNFNLSMRGIREMLKLNKPIYEITSAYGTLVESPLIKVNLRGKKQIKSIYLKCNLEKP